jgi:YqjK-like protein
MNKKLHILAQRRERLVQEAAQQRVQLAQAIEAWRSPLALADQGFAAIRYIKNHPFYMAAIGIVFVKLLKKSLIGRWFYRGKIALLFLRKLQSKFFS